MEWLVVGGEWWWVAMVSGSGEIIARCMASRPPTQPPLTSHHSPAHDQPPLTILAAEHEHSVTQDVRRVRVRARRQQQLEHGDAVAIDGQSLTPAQVLATLNERGGVNGVGRADIVENRYVGMKSRGCYETPGGSILLRAHRAIESITLDREVAHLKDELMPRYAKLIYNGYWWSPERHALQAAIDQTQSVVNGEVRLSLYKGNVTVVGRRSSDSLFDARIATFESDDGAYDQKDAEGFIKLNALRLRLAAQKGRQHQ